MGENKPKKVYKKYYMENRSQFALVLGFSTSLRIQLKRFKNVTLLNAFFFNLMLHVPVNSYGHVGMVR